MCISRKRYGYGEFAVEKIDKTFRLDPSQLMSNQFLFPGRFGFAVEFKFNGINRFG